MALIIFAVLPPALSIDTLLGARRVQIVLEEGVVTASIIDDVASGFINAFDARHAGCGVAVAKLSAAGSGTAENLSALKGGVQASIIDSNGGGLLVESSDNVLVCQWGSSALESGGCKAVWMRSPAPL